MFFFTHLGIPVSTTHTITGAIVGVGASRRVSAVRWGGAKSIVTAWSVTLPAARPGGGGVLLSRILDDVSDTGDKKQGGDKSGQRRRQVAALPWRVTSQDGLEILLVSSRETRRWVIPKGWPMKGKADHQAAAQEAYEEAGLDGRIVARPIGEYPYLKRLKSGAARPVVVAVFPLEVTGEHATWPEQGQRTLQWMTPVEAALAVQEPELRDLIARFAHVELPAEERPAPAPAPTPVGVVVDRLRRRVTGLWGRSRR